MSTYEPAFDPPLLAAAWHPLPSPSRLILKYAPHPSRPGYVLLLTDLTSVYCEVLTGPGVPSRMTEVKRTLDTNGRKKGKGKSKEVDEDDIIGKSEAALKDIGEMWAELGEAKVEMKEHDYHDAVLSVQTDDFAWLFYLTELKGRQPLEILSKHLIAPLAGILLETNNIKTEGKSEAMELVHTLFQQSPTITQHMAAHHGTSSSSSTTKGKRTTTPPPKAKPTSSKAAKSPAKSKAAPPPPQAEEEEEEEYVSEDEEATQPQTRSKDTPKKSTAKTDKSGSPKPASTKKTPTKKSRHVIESDTEAEAEPEAEAEAEAAAVSDKAMSPAEEKSEKSASPPPPTMSSQVSKKERERLEEEEMHARAEAMKRKMEGGGGGGNLGRRRLRR